MKVWRLEKMPKVSKDKYCESLVYAQYKSSAKRRDLEWELTKKQVLSITRKNCYYCDSPPSNMIKCRGGSHTYSGIDRVNNSEGYTINNVVPCCFQCNQGKNNLEQKDFLAKVSSIYTKFWGAAKSGDAELHTDCDAGLNLIST